MAPSLAAQVDRKHHPQRFVEKICVCDPTQADSVTECGPTWPKMAFVSHPRLVTAALGGGGGGRGRWQRARPHRQPQGIAPARRPPGRRRAASAPPRRAGDRHRQSSAVTAWFCTGGGRAAAARGRRFDRPLARPPAGRIRHALPTGRGAYRRPTRRGPTPSTRPAAVGARASGRAPDGRAVRLPAVGGVPRRPVGAGGGV